MYVPGRAGSGREVRGEGGGRRGRVEGRGRGGGGVWIAEAGGAESNEKRSTTIFMTDVAVCLYQRRAVTPVHLLSL